MRKRDLKNSIKKAMQKNKATPTSNSHEEYHSEVDEAQREMDHGTNSDIDSDNDLNQDNHLKNQNKSKEAKSYSPKSMKLFGVFCIAAFITSAVLTPASSVDTSSAAKNALKDKSSTSLSAGAILLEEDQNIGQQDYTITHTSTSEETKIWVWDYAAEDGDYVQVLVNGIAMTDSFMIKNKPKEFLVPTTGDIQVKGIKDGGGGITYAVRYDLNGTNYFNSAPRNEFNTYTLVRE